MIAQRLQRVLELTNQENTLGDFLCHNADTSWKARRYLSAITSKLRMLQVLILTPSDCNRATKLSNKFISSCLGSAPQLQSIIGISAGYDVRASELHGLKYLSSDSYLVTKKFPCQTPGHSFRNKKLMERNLCLEFWSQLCQQQQV